MSIQQIQATQVHEWMTREAIRFSFGEDFDAAVDQMMSRLGDQVSILGFGEPLHSGEEFLVLRNRLFQRLVEAHGFRAITIETNDMRARLIDAYVAGRGPAAYEGIADEGFSVGIGQWARNRELVEWMRRYNSDPAHAVKLNFYGTLASDQETTKSPRQALEASLAYLEPINAEAAAGYRERIEPHLGADADWEDSSAAMAKEIMARVLAGEKAAADTRHAPGLLPRIQALRLAVENLAFELRMHFPEFVAKSDRDSFGEALRHLSVSQNLLALHTALARREPLDTIVTMRDAMAAEHLRYIAEREERRGKVLVFLHSAHLRRTKTKLPWYEFWPTGAHLDHRFGARFAVIGGALGTSEANFIEAPETGSLEARLLEQQSDCFVPVQRGNRLSEGELAALPVRTGSVRPYVPYTPLSPQIVADLDGLAFLRSVTYTRGASALPG